MELAIPSIKNLDITPEIIKLELNKLQQKPERFLRNLSVHQVMKKFLLLTQICTMEVGMANRKDITQCARIALENLTSSQLQAVTYCIDEIITTEKGDGPFIYWAIRLGNSDLFSNY
ncbi:hypothetical protein [Coxiella-like endosymbiont]|uniref:hypothetical protein n=1 Tax=Coxiella-like endosymbiont TaxID=1592897 RepID=UPI00272DB7CA|nr:hypothetical protein [Coxiella-like endosymbiont]